jgi:hypothetical protein
MSDLHDIYKEDLGLGDPSTFPSNVSDTSVNSRDSEGPNETTANIGGPRNSDVATSHAYGTDSGNNESTTEACTRCKIFRHRAVARFLDLSVARKGSLQNTHH